MTRSIVAFFCFPSVNRTERGEGWSWTMRTKKKKRSSRDCLLFVLLFTWQQYKEMWGVGLCHNEKEPWWSTWMVWWRKVQGATQSQWRRGGRRVFRKEQTQTWLIAPLCIHSPPLIRFPTCILFFKTLPCAMPPPPPIGKNSNVIFNVKPLAHTHMRLWKWMNERWNESHTHSGISLVPTTQRTT